MVKIKLAILKSAKAKDGSHKIRISIGHKSETHYIVTRFAVPSLSNFKDGMIVGTPTAHHDNLKLRQLLTIYEDRLDRIPNPSQLSPKQLRDTLMQMGEPSADDTLCGMFRTVIGMQQSEGRNTHIITQSLQAVEKYFGDISLQAINPAYVEKVTKGLSRHYANATANMTLSQIRLVVNIAIRNGLVKYDVHPFAFWRALPVQFRSIDLTPEEMRAMLAVTPATKHQDYCRDIFFLSYYLGGINIADLMRIDLRSNTLDYIRKKTSRTSGQRIQLTIHPEARKIIDKHIGTNGRLNARPGCKQVTSRYLSYHLKLIAAKAGIKDLERICYYSARKSFVQHGFDLGIPLETLEYCVGHSVGRRTIYNYMRVMRRHADTAIEQIINNLLK